MDQWFTRRFSHQRKTDDERRRDSRQCDRYVLCRLREIAEVSDVELLLLLTVPGLTILLWWLDRRFEGLRFYIFAILVFPGTVVASWLLMKYTNTWLAFPPVWAAIVLVVPAVEVDRSHAG